MRTLTTYRLLSAMILTANYRARLVQIAVKSNLQFLKSYSNSQHPPSYFRHGALLPKTLDEIRSEQQRTQQTSPQPLSPSFPTPHSPHHTQLSNISAVSSTPSNSPSSSSSGGSSHELILGYLIIMILLGSYLIEYMLDAKVSEREVEALKKNQKDMMLQMQNYKKKVALHTVELTKKDVLIQGRMQMHIALLREQLIDNGLEPVKIEGALEKFEQEVKMQTTLTTIDLWVPGESRLKSYIPDAHEYSKK